MTGQAAAQEPALGAPEPDVGVPGDILRAHGDVLRTHARDIVVELLDFIERDRCTDEEFDDLALRLFAYQYANNEPFRRLCRRRGATLRNVKRWHDIPAVPVDGFKELELTSQAPAPSDRVFMTSGTTRGDLKGRNRHPTLAVYDRSMLVNFRRRFMGDTQLIRMAILFPDETVLPNSSLAHYLALAAREFGAPGSRHFVGTDGLAVEALCATIRDCERSGEPYALLGASYSFVQLLDRLAEQDLSFRLPAGSRILDTGGFKGQSRELPMDAFYDALSARLGVGREHCINMYGMTELSTQFYDSGNAVLPSVKSGPHWIRSQLLDPLSGRAVAHGERGLLAHCDLANFNSVTTVLTEDVGIAVESGFLLLGRAQGAEAKGCSLAIEHFIASA